MATFVDFVLSPPRHVPQTRAERINALQRNLADAKAGRGIYRRWSVTDRRSSVKRNRRELTREGISIRVERGEPLASRRSQWIRLVEAHRLKIDGYLGLRHHVTRIVADLDANRERLAAGTITKGRNKGPAVQRRDAPEPPSTDREK